MDISFIEELTKIYKRFHDFLTLQNRTRITKKQMQKVDEIREQKKCKLTHCQVIFRLCVFNCDVWRKFCTCPGICECGQAPLEAASTVNGTALPSYNASSDVSS